MTIELLHAYATVAIQDTPDTDIIEDPCDQVICESSVFHRPGIVCIVQNRVREGFNHPRERVKSKRRSSMPSRGMSTVQDLIDAFFF